MKLKNVHTKLSISCGLLLALLVTSIESAAVPSGTSGTQRSESWTSGQEQKISGRVVDENGDAVPKVSIHWKGAPNSYIAADDNGSFSIDRILGYDVLVFDAVGFQSLESPVTQATTTLNVVLLKKVNEMENIVVIGYGTAKKKDLTGAVSTVKGETISGRHESQLSNALQGLASGVMVTRDNSMPGASASIRIRGITTISNSNPLTLVDGIPVESINSVNPNDVESISILKDAASASIYGARASAGVILITTKQAKLNQLNIEYSGSVGLVSPTKFPQTVTYKRYMEMINEVAWNDGGNQAGAEDAVYPESFMESYAENNKLNPDVYPITDWVEVMIRDNAPFSRHSLSLSYGNSAVKTKAILNYETTDALYNNRSYNRITARLNNEIKITKFLSSDINVSYLHSLNENPSINPLSAAYKYGPLWAPYLSDGRISEGRNGTNAWARLNYGGFNNQWNDQLFGKFGLNIEPVKNLTITGVVAPTIQFTKVKDFNKQIPYYDPADPTLLKGYIDGNITTSLREGRNEVRTMTKQLVGNYKATVGNDHDLSFMAGYEDYYRFSEGLSSSSDNFLLSDFPYLDRAPLDYMQNSGDANENSYNSVFGRVIYSFANRYLLQANIRSDGSSRFHKDYRWGTFPSVSLGWVVTEESFFKKLDPKNFTFLKIRGSWGKLGNERIGNYPYQATMNFANALFVRGSQIVSTTTAAQRSLNIRDISWETTETWNVGFDATFFNSRLSLIADYYKKTTRDMLLDLEIPDFMGYDNPAQNAGTMNTKGWDLQLGWNDRIGDFRYSVSANLSDYKSVMGNLSGIVFDGSQIIRQGSEYNEWYGYLSDGLFQSAEDVSKSPLLSTVVKPGDVKYKDISGPDGVPDGKITPEYDRALLGGSLPRFLYGGNIDLSYKGFDASVIFQGVGKQTSMMGVDMVYQTTAWYTFPDFVDGNYYSQYNSAEQNKTARFPRLSQIGYDGNNYKMSDYWLFDGSYFRLKNITLGYTLPGKWINRFKLKNMRVYGSVSDLFSIDNYPAGWDPEAALTAYIAKTWNLGVTIRF